MQLADVEIRLILLGPTLARVPVLAVRRIGSKFTDNQRLVVLALPLEAIRIFRMPEIPAQIFVEAQNVEALSNRIIENSFIGALVRHVIQC